MCGYICVNATDMENSAAQCRLHSLLRRELDSWSAVRNLLISETLEPTPQITSRCQAHLFPSNAALTFSKPSGLWLTANNCPQLLRAGLSSSKGQDG